jgi:plasmid maintenance system killer protein
LPKNKTKRAPAKNLAAAKLLRSEQSIKALKKVDNSQRDAVAQCLATFRVNPCDRSLNFEKHKGFKNLYSIRVNIHLRIYLANTGGMLMQILEVGNHDLSKKFRK